ncbi:hypothetical protein ACQCSX_21900 (plasmid) [Pseudarthrobacter sp. P1]|uniref:hypothetical protein n=1 Tax=Pseudarthrobacter sp. P1 TaxID=3418418 RepID=UPI003CFAC9E9
MDRSGEFSFQYRGRPMETVGTGDYLCGGWEIIAPGAAASPDVVAVLVKRSQRYRAALAAQWFISTWDVHDGAQPVNLRALLKRRGGRVNKPGDQPPGVSARLMSPPAGFQVIWRAEDDGNRRQELLALAIAAREMDRTIDSYARTVDYDFSDTFTTRPDLYWFATLLLVPAAQAALAGNMESAARIGHDLQVDPARVHDAHRLWAEIATPEIPWALKGTP